MVIQVGSNPPKTLIDGGLGHNNPTLHLLREAKRLWPGRRLGSVLSIGTGTQKGIKLAKDNLQANFTGRMRMKIYGGMACKHIATSSELIHQSVADRFSDQPNTMFRFSVTSGMDFELDEYSKMAEIRTATKEYLEKTRIKEQMQTYFNVFNEGMQEIGDLNITETNPGEIDTIGLSDVINFSSQASQPIDITPERITRLNGPLEFVPEDELTLSESPECHGNFYLRIPYGLPTPSVGISPTRKFLTKSVQPGTYSVKWYLRLDPSPRQSLDFGEGFQLDGPENSGQSETDNPAPSSTTLPVIWLDATTAAGSASLSFTCPPASGSAWHKCNSEEFLEVDEGENVTFGITCEVDSIPLVILLAGIR